LPSTGAGVAYAGNALEAGFAGGNRRRRTAQGGLLREQPLEHTPRDPTTPALADLDAELLRLPLGIPAGVLGERVDRVVERALKAWMDLVELAKAAGDLRAIGADEQPVHLEQAHFGGVHEQFYRVRLGQVDEAAVLDGVDAKEIIVVGGTDEAFELREDIRCPASCRSERAEALAQETLVDRRRDTHLMHLT